MYQKTITILIQVSPRRCYFHGDCNTFNKGGEGIARFRVDGDVTAAKGRADGNDYLSLHLRFPGAMCSN